RTGSIGCLICAGGPNIGSTVTTAKTSKSSVAAFRSPATLSIQSEPQPLHRACGGLGIAPGPLCCRFGIHYLNHADMPARRAREAALASWNDGPAKQAIFDFVRATTAQGSPQFVPPEDRIATFDQDGTLWVEHPIYSQVVYCLDRVPAV